MVGKFLLASALLILSCSSAQKANGIQQDRSSMDENTAAFKKLASDKYGKDVIYYYNSDSTFVLCSKTSKPTPRMPQNTIMFFLWDIRQNQIKLEESLVDGSVRWISNTQLQIVEHTGTVSKENPENRMVYVFDTATGKRTESKEDPSIQK